MTGKQLGMLAAGGSAVLLLAAFVFQALGNSTGSMCVRQRYPHGVAIAAGALLVVGLSPAGLMVIGAAAAATTSASGVYHTGVERDWWQGSTTCTGSGLDLSNLSGSDLLPSASSGPSTLVMCDEVAWEFLSLSMASWNALWSATLVGLWLFAFAREWQNRQTQSAYSAT